MGVCLWGVAEVVSVSIRASLGVSRRSVLASTLSPGLGAVLAPSLGMVLVWEQVEQLSPMLGVVPSVVGAAPSGLDGAGGQLG